MRVGPLHRKITQTVQQIHAAVGHLWPVDVPVRYTQLFSVKVFVRRLNKCTEPLGVFNEIKWDNDIKPGHVQLGGWWLPKTELPENGSFADIRLIWHVHPSTKKLQFTQTDWNRRRYRFWQMLMHELIHRYQQAAPTRSYRPRSHQRDVKEEQDYYGSFDEIETHSHEAAMELAIWWGHLSYQAAVTEVMSYTGRVLRPAYIIYHTVFCRETGRRSHPAWKHFERKVKAWYDVMKQHPEIYYDTLELPQLVD